jgi:aspartate/tyrosine/aromatic aminotransferase
MLLGENSPALAEGRAFGVQALSGTGALRSEFIVSLVLQSRSRVILLRVKSEPQRDAVIEKNWTCLA